jgi:hypothetical protein
MALTGARDSWHRSSAARLGVFCVAMIVIAEGAVLLLRPDDDGPDPVAVSPGDFFDPSEVARATDYRDGHARPGISSGAWPGARSWAARRPASSSSRSPSWSRCPHRSPRTSAPSTSASRRNRSARGSAIRVAPS